MPTGTKRWLGAAWVVLICGFAVLHALHLRADFPNHSPWMHDWAKYTDEGWYGNAAVRAHLFGHWYLAKDFNPAIALPVWPFLEWLLFFLTGVSVEAARGLVYRIVFCQPDPELPAAAQSRNTLGGIAGSNDAGDEPFSLLLQPTCHPGTFADDTDAHRAESCRPHRGPSASSLACCGRRPPVHADDADQDNSPFPLACAGVGDAASFAREPPTRTALRCRGCSNECVDIRDMDGTRRACRFVG